MNTGVVRMSVKSLHMRRDGLHGKQSRGAQRVNGMTTPTQWAVVTYARNAMDGDSEAGEARYSSHDQAASTRMHVANAEAEWGRETSSAEHRHLL